MGYCNDGWWMGGTVMVAGKKCEVEWFPEVITASFHGSRSSFGSRR